MDLQDLPDPTFAEMMYDLSAKVMALITLGVEQKMFSEEKFQRTKTYCERLIDEERTKRKDDRERLTKQALNQRLEELHERLVRGYCSSHPYAKLDLFRDRQVAGKPQLGLAGTICIRIIDPDWADLPAHEFDDPAKPNIARYEVIEKLITDWCNEREENFRLCLVTPEERPTSEMSLEFDNKIQLITGRRPEHDDVGRELHERGTDRPEGPSPGDGEGSGPEP